jgi:hypothetical protein
MFRKEKMGRWQRKLLFTLIVYFAGFGTAIYVLAPAKQPSSSPDQPAAAVRVARGAGISTEDAAKLRETMYRGVNKLKDFAEEQTVRAADFFRRRLDQQQTEDG